MRGCEACALPLSLVRSCSGWKCALPATRCPWGPRECAAPSSRLFALPSCAISSFPSLCCISLGHSCLFWVPCSCRWGGGRLGRPGAAFSSHGLSPPAQPPLAGAHLVFTGWCPGCRVPLTVPPSAHLLQSWCSCVGVLNRFWR